MVAPLRQPPLVWVEVVVITLCAVALGLFFQYDNPFQVGGEFPWIWLAPVLVALRYGVAPGFVSSLLLIVIWELMDYLMQTHEVFPKQFFLGGLILAMVTGEFSALWSTRLRRAEETNRYLDERLGRITLRHLLLRLSHDRMEQELLTKPMTLRDALGGLRQLTVVPSDELLPAPSSLLQLLTQYCRLESAALYKPSAHGYICVSKIGDPPELTTDDPLLRHALKNQSLSHLLIEGGVDAQVGSPFLVVAPILTSTKRLQGVLAIERMPFLALNTENLQMLAVMLGYYADSVDEAEDIYQFKAKLPTAPADFSAEFTRLLHMQRAFGISSFIVALPFSNDEHGQQAVASLMQVRRGLDVTWQVIVGARIWIVNLMPLASDGAVDGYLLRTESLLKEYIEMGMEEWRLTPVRISLAEANPLAMLQHLLVQQHD